MWFNGRTLAFQAGYVGSIPITCSHLWAPHFVGKEFSDAAFIFYAGGVMRGVCIYPHFPMTNGRERCILNAVKGFGMEPIENEDIRMADI